jgi:hypothetical protein
VDLGFFHIQKCRFPELPARVIFEFETLPMRSSANAQRRCQAKSDPHRRVDLEEVLQSLRIVLEMEPDHLDGAIDLLDEAIHHDRRNPRKLPGCRI